MCELKGKTALITGASRGIGREFAITLAKCGADIVLSYVGNDQKAKETQKDVESFGVRCRLAKCDLSQANCAGVISQIAPRTDILVLNASVQYRTGWQDITLDEFDRQINCNLRSALLLIQAYAPAMAERKWGRIISIGSVQERKPHPNMLVYSASKAALTHMAKSLALQLAPDGITVNSIAPGVILTDRNTDALSDPDYCGNVLEKIPLGILGEPKDCAGILRLLCSDDGRYITGQNIFTDGGMGI